MSRIDVRSSFSRVHVNKVKNHCTGSRRRQCEDPEHLLENIHFFIYRFLSWQSLVFFFFLTAPGLPPQFWIIVYYCKNSIRHHSSVPELFQDRFIHILVPGTLEVLDPEDDDSLKRPGSRKTYICDDQELARTQQPINSQNGKLEVLGPTENVFIHAAESASRPGSSACRQGSAGRKCSASAKQISLCTVKRITPSCNVPDYNVADFKDSKKIDLSEARGLLSCRPDSSAGRYGSAGRKCCASTKQISLCTVKRVTPSSNIPDYNMADLKDVKKIDTDPMQKEPVPPNPAEKESTEVHSATIQSSNFTELPQESSSDDDDEDDSDNEKPAAPLELLTEFIKAVMDGDYKLAWKLCQMILIYEPENPEAKEFSPLIQKMLQNEEDHVSSDEDSEDTDEDDDSSDTDDSDSNSTETSEASSEDEADD